MGKWGPGPFENDGGADFADDLEELAEPALLDALRSALRAVLDAADPVDGTRAEAGSAAAGVVACGLDGDNEFKAANRNRRSPPPMPDDLVALAADAVDRLRTGDSDVREDWTEEGRWGTWDAAMRRLYDVLCRRDGYVPDTLW